VVGGVIIRGLTFVHLPCPMLILLLQTGMVAVIPGMYALHSPPPLGGIFVQMQPAELTTFHVMLVVDVNVGVVVYYPPQYFHYYKSYRRQGSDSPATSFFFNFNLSFVSLPTLH